MPNPGLEMRRQHLMADERSWRWDLAILQHWKGPEPD